MGSKVVVTYKRKRLFSRSDHSPLHSHRPSEILYSKSSSNFNNHEDPIGICHEHSKGNVGENVLHFENCDSVYCGQCSEKQDCSSISNRAQQSTLEQKRQSPQSDAEQIKSHPDVFLKGNPGETCQIDSAGQSNGEEKSAHTQSELLVKSGSAYGDKCKKETNLLNEDQCSTLCNNSGTKRKLTSTLITFYRRCKRKRDIASPDTASEYADATSASVTPPAASFSVDLKNEKNLREEIPSVQQKVCTDVQEIEHLSISSRAIRDIDCNLPLDCDSDENHLPVPLEVPHDSLGSASKMKENIPILQVQCAENGSPVNAVSDKGKFVIDSPPMLTSTSSKNNYLQLFPENRPNEMLHLTNDPEKVANEMLHLTNDPEKVAQPHLLGLQPSRFHGFSLQPDQMVNGHACYSSSYDWPTIQPQTREAFRDFLYPTSYQVQSFSRHKMMLDNISTRARAIRGNTWSEEELDSLWIGVRRHGRGNWEAILRDRGLHLSPWKTPIDLADKWQEEQARLFYGVTVFHKNRQFFRKPVTNSPYGYLGNWGLLSPLVGSPSLREESSSNAGVGGPMKGSLPHWLREAVEIPPRPPEPIQIGMQWPNQANFEWLNSSYPSMQRTNEPQSGGEAHCTNPRGKTDPHDRQVSKQDDLIIIPSDASSEETISDDRSIRP